MARYLPHHSFVYSINVATSTQRSTVALTETGRSHGRSKMAILKSRNSKGWEITVSSITLTQTQRNVTQGMTTWLTESSETATPGFGKLQAVSRVDGDGGR